MSTEQMEDEDVKRRLGVGATDEAEPEASPDEQAAPTPDADDADDSDDEEDQE